MGGHFTAFAHKRDFVVSGSGQATWVDNIISGKEMTAHTLTIYVSGVVKNPGFGDVSIPPIKNMWGFSGVFP